MKPRGARLGIRKGGKSAVRLPKIPVLTRPPQVLGCFYGANTNEWQAMAMARRGNDKALAYVARQRALDPLSPCETQVSN